MGMAGRRRRTSAPPVRALRVLRHDLTTERHEPDEPRGWMTYYGRFTPAALQPLLKRINGYLVRWARKKYRRLAPFKRAKRWWTTCSPGTGPCSRTGNGRALSSGFR